jgi:hypothetical protein
MTTNRGRQPTRPVLKLHEVESLQASDDQVSLQRFVETIDEAAFRVTAERHGPMMFGVCRRALKCPYDAV